MTIGRRARSQVWQDGRMEVEERVASLPGGSIRYLLRRSARSRGLRVTIDRRSGAVVSVPVATRRGWSRPEPAIERFLAEREAWLRRHLDRQVRERTTLEARGGLRDGALVRYRGELHRLAIVPAEASASRRSTVSREPAPNGSGADVLVVRLGAADRRDLSAVLADSFRARARRSIEREIARHAGALEVTPSRVTIRDTRSRWGSASRSGALSFSWRLVLAPPEALETVVVHELAHLRVFGHGPKFWALVASRRPDHATWRRWLREHSFELHAALDEIGAPAGRDERVGS
ncbi:MAG TPA: SprT family zinc-dependent metalloprotease [Candidatus Limnocylindrales bacterium]|nr:SprT family zinc-dependent metalloprotease [Candidatus Limnocylindrales bacterium]